MTEGPRALDALPTQASTPETPQKNHDNVVEDAVLRRALEYKELFGGTINNALDSVTCF